MELMSVVKVNRGVLPMYVGKIARDYVTWSGQTLGHSRFNHSTTLTCL